MKKLILTPLVILLTLAAGSVTADDRHGWRGAGHERHVSRFDGPEWRVSINFNSPGFNHRPLRRAWSNPGRYHRDYWHGHRRDINTGIVFGSLFSTGFIGNYGAIGRPGRDWRRSGFSNTSPSYGRYANGYKGYRGHSAIGKRITRCYETGIDRQGRKYRVELDPGFCR